MTEKDMEIQQLTRDLKMAENQILVLRNAIETYGVQNQVLKSLEEMSELSKELLKNAQNSDNIDAIAEEIADVQITLAQIIMIFDVAEPVESWKKKKLNRLRLNLAADKIRKEGHK